MTRFMPLACRMSLMMFTKAGSPAGYGYARKVAATGA